MTIKEFIIDREMVVYEGRLENLIELGAPDIMIESQRKMVDALKRGDFKVGGDSYWLDYEFSEWKTYKGRGGKMYVQFDGKVNYFPTAKYGRYIKEVK